MEIATLPEINYELVGTNVKSNLLDYKTKALELVEQTKIEPVTDQDFANAEVEIKSIDAGKKKLQALKKSFLSETGEISDFISSLDSIIDSFASASLARKKQVKTKKEETKDKIVADNLRIFKTAIDEVNKELCGQYMGHIVPNFGGAMKGKRTIESLVKAANGELERLESEIETHKEIINQRLVALTQSIEGYEFLFNDVHSIISSQEPEHIKLTVSTRISEYKADQEKKALEAARLAEEQAKLADEIIENAREARAKEPEPKEKEAPVNPFTSLNPVGQSAESIAKSMIDNAFTEAPESNNVQVLDQHKVLITPPESVSEEVQRMVNRAAVDTLAAASGISKIDAKLVIKAIIKGQVKSIKMDYSNV